MASGKCRRTTNNKNQFEFKIKFCWCTQRHTHTGSAVAKCTQTAIGSVWLRLAVCNKPPLVSLCDVGTIEATLCNDVRPIFCLFCVDLSTSDATVAATPLHCQHTQKREKDEKKRFVFPSAFFIICFWNWIWGQRRRRWRSFEATRKSSFWLIAK